RLSCCVLLSLLLFYYCFFFFQAEDGIRDRNVTGVQTCALPIVCRCEGAWDTEGQAPQKDLSRHTRRLRRAGRTNPIQYEESGAGPVAAIDAGTNSVRLLIAKMTEHGMQELHRDMRIVRLGQGVDETGEFAPEALDRTFAAVHEYAKEITRHGAYPTRFIATSASRDV